MYEHILIPTRWVRPFEEGHRAWGCPGEVDRRLGGRNHRVAHQSHDDERRPQQPAPTFHTFAVNPVIVTETPERYRKNCEARAERYVGVVRDVATAAGVAYEGVHAIADHPHQAIIATARDKQCDLICMASHGRKGVSALVLGSETTKVLAHSKIPVLVCR
jgi:nucleotide-binding universal stress UspA family protein